MIDHDDVAGSPAGYWWHQRNNVPTCDPCREAHRLATRRRRDIARPDTARTLVPLALLGRILATVPDDVADRARAELGSETVDRAQALAEHPRD